MLPSMEASSLLVAPKHSMSRTVSLLLPARGATRSCIVAGAGKERGGGRSNSDGEHQRQEGPRKLRSAHGGLLAVAAATGGALPCGASSLYYRTVVVLGDLEPATARAVAGVAGPALSALGFLFIVRIVMSWYPRLPVTKFPYVVAYAPTEPFLAVTRKVIPPLGGVDVTPVVWFGLVSFLSEILVGPQGLLVLLSQQQG